MADAGGVCGVYCYDVDAGETFDGLGILGVGGGGEGGDSGEVCGGFGVSFFLFFSFPLLLLCFCFSLVFGW